MDWPIIYLIVVAALCVLWFIFLKVGQIFGCPNCGAITGQKDEGQDHYDPYPIKYCKHCKNCYYTLK